MGKEHTEIAVFAGGCFWCTEAVFSAGGGSAYGGKIFKGILSVVPGYTGGSVPKPSYEQVCGGKTGHVEAVQIIFNPAHIAYRTLLTVFFATHDPTTLNRQGNDVGTQYRSAIFYTTPGQKKEAEDFIKNLNNSSKFGVPIVTEVVPLTVFFEAENYHRDYFATHPGNPYSELVINPKLEKVQKEFSDLLKISVS